MKQESVVEREGVATGSLTSSILKTSKLLWIRRCFYVQLVCIPLPRSEHLNGCLWYVCLCCSSGCPNTKTVSVLLGTINA